jgi:hypothetical protein
MARSSSAEEIAIAQLAGGRERRKQRRYTCNGPAEVLELESRCFYRGEIRELSLTGCYVTTGDAELELDPRADVQLCLYVNGDPIETPARVIMVRPDSGAAFQFLPIEPEMRAALLTLISKLSTLQASAEPVKVA